MNTFTIYNMPLVGCKATNPALDDYTGCKSSLHEFVSGWQSIVREVVFGNQVFNLQYSTCNLMLNYQPIHRQSASQYEVLLARWMVACQEDCAHMFDSRRASESHLVIS